MDKLDIYCIEYIMKFLDTSSKISLAQTSEYYRELFVRWVRHHLSIADRLELRNLSVSDQENLIRVAGDCLTYYHMSENVLHDIVKHCTKLKHITVQRNYTSEFDNDIVLITHLKSLESIDYDTSGVWDKTLTKFVLALKDLPNLCTLCLHSEGYSGKHLSELVHIRNLALYECKSIEWKYFEAFCKSMKQLENLYLYGDYGFIYKMYPGMYRAMASHCHELKYLWLSDITGKCEFVADLPKLKGLCYVLNGDSYRNKLFKALADKKNEQLQCLKLMTGDAIKLQNAEFIGRIISLRELSFRFDDIECIEKLNQLKNLEYLSLECNHLSESHALCLISLYPKLIYFGTDSDQLTERFLLSALQILRNERKNGLRKDAKLVMGVKTDFENSLKSLKIEHSEKYLELTSLEAGYTQYTLMDLYYYKNMYKHHHH